MDKVLLYKALAKNGAEKSASGNPVVLTDTIEGKLLKDLKLYGMSKQESTTGANLIDIDSILNECLIKNDDGTYSILKTETNRFSKSFPVNLTAGTKVRLDADVIEYSGTYASHLRINFSNWQSIRENETLIINSDVTRAEIYQHKENDVGAYTKFKNAMLSIGEAQIPYEPYTGGKLSPSPEYPQEIVSVGGNGSIEVNVRGKNLTDIYGYSANSIENPEDKRTLNNEYGTTLNTTEKTDKLIVNQEILDGGVVGSYKSGYFVIGINRKLEVGKDYIITFRINVIRNPLSASRVEVSFNGIEFEYANVTGDKVTVKAKYTEYRERQYVEVRNNGMSVEVSEFMITEVGETDNYEPYTEQTVQLHHTLNAIPTATGIDANITIGGQRYVADYVDVDRGKFVQRVGFVDIPDNAIWRIQKQDGRYALGYIAYPNAVSTKTGAVMLSNIGKGSERWNNTFCFGTSNVFWLVPYENDGTITSDDINAWLAKHPMKVLYQLKEPIETDLAPEEIEALKALKTYTGTTIVGNDAECYMEVTAGGANVLRAKKIAMLLGE